jgi:hypothetical protein
MAGFRVKLKSSFLTIFEVFSFFFRKRVWWLLPFLLSLALVVILVLLVQKAGTYPFVYVLF